MPRSLSIAARILGGIFLATASALGWLGWRLANDHPIHFGFLVPALQRTLGTTALGIRFELDDFVLAWKPGRAVPGLWVVGLRGYASDGHLVGAIHEVGFHISLAALAHGMLAPASIEVLAPAINLRREADGEFKILGVGGDSPAGDSGPIGGGIFDRLLAPPDPSRITGYMREVKITAGSLVFEDRTTGQTWHAPKIDFDLIRNTGEVTGRFSAQLSELGNPATISADMDLRSITRRLDLKVALQGLQVSSLVAIRPVLAQLAGLHLKINGQVQTSLAEDGRLGDLGFTVTGGPGSIALPQTLSAPLDISSLSVAGTLQAGFDRLAIDAADINLGNTKIEARAQVSGLSSPGSSSGQLRVKGDVDVRNLAVSDVPRLWPLSGGQSSGGRDWFAGQIDRGTIEEAKASLDLAFGGLAAPQILAFGGSLDATGVRVRYFKSLPPVENASLAAHFNASSLVIDVRSGAIGRLSIDNAKVTLDGLDRPDQSVDLAGDVSGPLRDALVLLDAPGLGYLHGTGINVDRSGGRLSARFRVGFPLLADLPLARVDALANLHIEDASLDNLFAGQGLSNGNFDLNLDDRAMVAIGEAAIGGVPFTLRWDENFGDQGPKTRIVVRARPNAGDLARFGINLQNTVVGSVPCEIVYRRFTNGFGELGIDADLTDSALALDFARWRKAPGVPGKASATLELTGMRPYRISAFSLDAGDASAEGYGQFAEGGRLQQVAFDRLSFGKTRLNGVVVDFASDRIEARVSGGDFNAEPFLNKASSTGIVDNSSRPATSAGNSPRAAFTYVLAPSHLNRVLFGSGREIDSLQLSLVHDGAFFRSAQAEGTLLGGGDFAFSWLPADASSHRLIVTAGDAGAALKALSVFDDVAGGRLTVLATSQDDAPGRPIRGHVEVSEYHLLHQSALLRLFTIATLTGIADMASGSGMLMHRFVADFTRTYGRVDVPLARTYGPSVGLTAKGYFDVSTDSIDMKGTIVPVNALNSFVGKIPLIGFLVTGGQGGGGGSFTYTATGKLSQPDFSVNPLSALDPGFLKGIFDLPGGGGNPPDALPAGAGQQ